MWGCRGGGVAGVCRTAGAGPARRRRVDRVNPAIFQQSLRHASQSTQLEESASRKKQEVFYLDEVQDILRSLTVYKMESIFRPRKEGKATERSVYQFVTQEELEQMQQDYRKKAEEKLQMPPVMEERNPLGRILEQDPKLIGFDNSKLVFTDITFGIPDRERLIVVRDQDGTLRTADWEEQDRINHVYFPREERRHYVPPLFEPKNLLELLAPEKYEYLLDRNCVQFEPDHPTYIRTAEIVYDHVNENRNFRALESTRHYGPLLFYLAWTKQIDEVLVHTILDKNVSGAESLVKLYQLVTQDTSFELGSSAEKSIRNFAKSSAARRGQKIIMALEKL